MATTGAPPFWDGGYDLTTSVMLTMLTGFPLPDANRRRSEMLRRRSTEWCFDGALALLDDLFLLALERRDEVLDGGLHDDRGSTGVLDDTVGDGLGLVVDLDELLVGLVVSILGACREDVHVRERV